MKKANIEKGLELVVKGLGVICEDAGINVDDVLDALNNVEVGAKDSDGMDDRRAELEAMKYNDLKAEAKKIGAKAVGKAPQIIDAILELEGAEDPDDDADDVEDDNDTNENEVTVEEMQEVLEGLEDKEVKAIATEMEIKTTKRRVGNVIKDMLEDADTLADLLAEKGYLESDDDGEGEELTLEEAQEFMNELDDADVKEIAKEMGIKTAKRKVASIKKDILADLEKLDETLDALGYYEEDEDGSDEGDDEVADYLDGLSSEELADICESYDLSKTGKKQSLIDRIIDAVDKGEIDPEELMSEDDGDDDDSDEGEAEGYTKEDVDEFLSNDLEKADVVTVADELGVKLTAKDKKSKAKIVAKIVDSKEVDEIVEVLENLGFLEDDEEFEPSEARLEAEEKIEADIRKQYKSKKLKDATIKKFVTKYYDGDPDFKAGKKDELLEQYIEIKVSLVDDEGEVIELEDPYVRDDVDYCCGAELVDGDNEGDLYCEICGNTYGDDEE